MQNSIKPTGKAENELFPRKSQVFIMFKGCTQQQEKVEWANERKLATEINRTSQKKRSENDQ